MPLARFDDDGADRMLRAVIHRLPLVLIGQIIAGVAVKDAGRRLLDGRHERPRLRRSRHRRDQADAQSQCTAPNRFAPRQFTPRLSTRSNATRFMSDGTHGPPRLLSWDA